MTGEARFYALAPDGDPQPFPPLICRVTAEEAQAMSVGYVVMWSPGKATFARGSKTPGPEVRFFHDGQEVINPWSAFRPLPDRTVYAADEPDVRQAVQRATGSTIRERIAAGDEEAIRLFEAFGGSAVSE